MNDKLQKLLRAAELGDVQVVRRLLELGLPVNLRNEKGWNALTVAAYHQHVELVEFLLSRGADPNSANVKGTTALMYAKTNARDFRILEILLAAGAKINATDDFGLTILDYVRRSERPELSAFLENKGALAAADLKRSSRLE